MSTIASLGVKEEIKRNKLFHFTKQIYPRDGFGTKLLVPLIHIPYQKGEDNFYLQGYS